MRFWHRWVAPHRSLLEINQRQAQTLAGELPDQLAFGARGSLYISLALSNQISVLASNGAETARYANAPGDAIPLDNPAGIAFDARTKSLLIVNHALLSGNPANFAVLQMAADDPGAPLFEPVLP